MGSNSGTDNQVVGVMLSGQVYWIPQTLLIVPIISVSIVAISMKIG